VGCYERGNRPSCSIHGGLFLGQLRDRKNLFMYTGFIYFRCNLYTYMQHVCAYVYGMHVCALLYACLCMYTCICMHMYECYVSVCMHAALTFSSCRRENATHRSVTAHAVWERAVLLLPTIPAIIRLVTTRSVDRPVAGERDRPGFLSSPVCTEVKVQITLRLSTTP
jgi:hypothetical protein